MESVAYNHYSEGSTEDFFPKPDCGSEFHCHPM